MGSGTRSSNSATARSARSGLHTPRCKLRRVAEPARRRATEELERELRNGVECVRVCVCVRHLCSAREREGAPGARSRNSGGRSVTPLRRYRNVSSDFISYLLLRRVVSCTARAPLPVVQLLERRSSEWACASIEDSAKIVFLEGS